MVALQQLNAAVKLWRDVDQDFLDDTAVSILAHQRPASSKELAAVQGCGDLGLLSFFHNQILATCAQVLAACAAAQLPHCKPRSRLISKL